MYGCRNIYIGLFTFPCEPQGSLLGPTDVPYLRLRRWPFGTRRGDGGLDSGVSNRDPIETLDDLMVSRTLKMPLRTL